MEGYYPKPTRQDVEVVPAVSLVDFRRSWESPEGAALSKKCGLPNISPRLAFAIGEDENFPNLNSDLKMDWLAVLSMETCKFDGGVRVPVVWWIEGERKARLGFFDFRWHDYDFVGLLGEVPLVS